MNELIEIEERDGRQTVNARELHAALEVARDFSTWIKDRIEKYGFVAGKDYETYEDLSSPDLGSAKARPQVRVQYAITVTMAKELATVENNDKGRAVRRHLIQVEEAWNSPELVMARALQAASHAIEEHRRMIAGLKPKADLADRMLNTGNLRTLTEVGKILARPRKIFTDLIECGVLYRTREGVLLPYQHYIDQGLFEVRYNIVKIGDHEERRPQTYITAAGERWLADGVYAPRLKI